MHCRKASGDIRRRRSRGWSFRREVVVEGRWWAGLGEEGMPPDGKGVAVVVVVMEVWRILVMTVLSEARTVPTSVRMRPPVVKS